MDAQLGRLSGSVRAKDAELASLHAALQAQFDERNALRGDVAALQAQLARLQGEFGMAQAQLRESKAARTALQSQQPRCAVLAAVLDAAAGRLVTVERQHLDVLP